MIHVPSCCDPKEHLVLQEQIGGGAHSEPGNPTDAREAWAEPTLQDFVEGWDPSSTALTRALHRLPDARQVWKRQQLPFGFCMVAQLLYPLLLLRGRASMCEMCFAGTNYLQS